MSYACNQIKNSFQLVMMLRNLPVSDDLWFDNFV